MLKGIFVSFNLAFLYLLSLILANGVNITLDCADQMDSPGELIVKVNFQKETLGGFAKFQQNFPQDSEIEVINNAGARAEVANGQMKLIWMNNLPETDFSIEYKVKITNPEVNNLKVGGKFTYLTTDNQRMTFDVPIKNVKVGEDPIVAEKPKPQPEASFTRLAIPKGSDQYLMQISISKKHLNDFAKVEEFLPEGAVATAEETNGAVFSQINKKVKFVWMNIPGSENLMISYNVDMSRATTKEISIVEGKFSFVHEGSTKQLEIPASSSGSSAPALAQNTSKPETSISESTTQESSTNNSSQENSAPTAQTVTPTIDNSVETKTTIPTSPKVEAPATEKPKTTISEKPKTVVVLAPKQTIKPKTTTPKTSSPIAKNTTTKAKPSLPKSVTPSVTRPQNGVHYRVQLMASHKSVGASYFEERHKYKGNFITENHSGWVKYTTGEFGVYRQARDHRNVMKNPNYKFPGPFVVAYNSGDRITVQEALMITGQKWVQ